MKSISRLSLLAFAIAAAPSVAADEAAAKACYDTLRNVGNNLPAEHDIQRRPQSARHRLAAATSFLERGRACTAAPGVRAHPNFPSLKQLLETAFQRVADVERDLAQVEQAELLRAEAKALRKRVLDSDGSDLPTLREQVQAFVARATAAAKDNRRVDSASVTRFEDALAEAEARAASRRASAAKEAIAALAIVDRLPGFRPEDSLDLARVGDALASAPSELLVHTVRLPAQGVRRTGEAPPGSRFSTYDHELIAGGPISFDLGRDHRDHQRFVEESKPAGLLRYGAQVDSVAPTLGLAEARLWDLAPGTPGLVWSKAGHDRVVFVTLDGGRYLTDLAALAPGAPSAWPERLQHALLVPQHIERLASAGQLPARLHQAVEAASGRWAGCHEKTWSPFKRRLDALDAANLLEDAREARKAQAHDEFQKAVHDKCAAHLKAYEKAVLNAIRHREAERESLYEKVKSRFGAP